MTLRTIDTNILLRHLTDDDPIQSPLAARFIDAPKHVDKQLLVTLPVICEVTRLLRSRRYDLSREQIADAWEYLLNSNRFRFQERIAMINALEAFREGPAALSDYLILHPGRKENAIDVVTFDTAFAEAERVTLLK